MAVKIDGDKMCNVPILPEHQARQTFHEPASTDAGKYLARAQAAISAIRRTQGDMAGYAMDCVCDIAHTLAITAEVLTRQLSDYGCTPEEG